MCRGRCRSRGRSGSCCRGRTGLEWLARICTAQCEIKRRGMVSVVAQLCLATVPACWQDTAQEHPPAPATHRASSHHPCLVQDYEQGLTPALPAQTPPPGWSPARRTRGRGSLPSCHQDLEEETL